MIILPRSETASGWNSLHIGDGQPVGPREVECIGVFVAPAALHDKRAVFGFVQHAMLKPEAPGRFRNGNIDITSATDAFAPITDFLRSDIVFKHFIQ